MINFLKNILIIFLIATFFCCNRSVFAVTYDVNILVIGDVRAGKSSLIQRIVNGKFLEGYNQTNWQFTPAFVSGGYYQLGEGDSVRYLFWDAPGFQQGAIEENEKVLACVKKANVVIILTDLSLKEESRQVAGDPIAAVIRWAICAQQRNEKCKIIVVGSHADVVTDEVKREFKYRIDELFSKVFKTSIDCCVVSAKKADDPGTAEFIRCLDGVVKSLNKGDFRILDDSEMKLSGDMRRCTECPEEKVYPVEMLVAKEGLFYCPKHSRKAFEIVCPGSDSVQKGKHYFLREEGQLYTDGKKYCQSCIRVLTQKKCQKEGCDNTITPTAEKQFTSKVTGKCYCCEEHLRQADGTPCEGCNSVYLMPGEGQKVGDKKLCSQCVSKGRCRCDALGKVHYIEGNQFIGKGGKMYCSEKCMRDTEGFKCDYCGKRFLEQDKGWAKKNEKYYCSEQCMRKAEGWMCPVCKNYFLDEDKGTITDIRVSTKYCCEEHALEGEGVYCALGTKCRRYLCKHFKCDMCQGVCKQTQGKWYCCDECKRYAESFLHRHFG